MKRSIFVIVLTAALFPPMTARAQAPEAAAAPVVVAPVVEHDIQVGQTFVGTVMPARQTDVGSAVDGRVVEYAVRQGDYVKQGQKLAQLLTGLLEIERRAAEADRDLRRAELLELQNGARPEELERWRALVAGRKALSDYTKLRLKRIQRLVESRTATEDELQDAVSKADAAVQLYQEGKADLDMAVKGPRDEAIAQAKARLATAEEAVHRIEDQLEKHTIRSPFDGYVVAENTQVGAWVSQGGLVAKVVELQYVDVECQVLESYLPFLTVGTEVRVDIPSLPGRVFIGEVFRIIQQADVRSRTFPVKVRLKNEFVDDQPLIRSGLFARVVLPTGSVAKAMLAPKDAVVLGGRDAVVWIADPAEGSTAKARPVSVELGAAHEGWIQIKGDVRPGQMLVVEGNERLQPGQVVSAVRQLSVPATLSGDLPPRAANEMPSKSSSLPSGKESG